MKYIDMLGKISTVLIMLLLAVVAYTLVQIDKKSTNFYEYQDKKINIKQVKQIVPRVDYIITFKEDKNVDIFHRYSTILTKHEIANIKKFLELAQKSAYYNVEIVAYMKFDKTNIELFHSKEYLKKPAQYSVDANMLAVLKSYGIDDFQYKNLEKLKEKIYKDSQVFFDEVMAYAKLKKNAWSEKNIPLLGLGDNGIKFMHNVDEEAEELTLNDENIETIVKSLEDAYAEYESMQ